MKLDFESEMAEIEKKKTAKPKVLCLSSIMESK